MVPPLRTAPGRPRPSSMVVAVPWLMPPFRQAKASLRSVAPGKLWCKKAAMQSVGTTSKPTPGMSMICAARAAASCPCANSKAAISPVMSR